MQKRNTKEIIILEALKIFAAKGYDGTSVRDIAGAVGIKESSLYKHFRSKQDIFDNILISMNNRYNELSQSANLPADETAASFYKTISEDTLLQMSEQLFLYYLNDEFASTFRKMLTVEQYKKPDAAKMLRETFYESALNYQSALFAEMISQGTFIEAEPYTMALHFFAPVYMLLLEYDTQPDKTDEALQKLKTHVLQFNEIYRKK